MVGVDTDSARYFINNRGVVHFAAVGIFIAQAHRDFAAFPSGS